MKREDFMVPNDSPFGKHAALPIGHTPPPGPSTQAICHGPNAHGHVRDLVHHENEPKTREPYAMRVRRENMFSHDGLQVPEVAPVPNNPRPETDSDSLHRSDPRHDDGYIRRSIRRLRNFLGRGAGDTSSLLLPDNASLPLMPDSTRAFLQGSDPIDVAVPDRAADPETPEMRSDPLLPSSDGLGLYGLLGRGPVHPGQAEYALNSRHERGDTIKE